MYRATEWLGGNGMPEPDELRQADELAMGAVVHAIRIGEFLNEVRDRREREGH
jgi:hypothetical protein